MYQENLEINISLTSRQQKTSNKGLMMLKALMRLKRKSSTSLKWFNFLRSIGIKELNYTEVLCFLVNLELERLFWPELLQEKLGWILSIALDHNLTRCTSAWVPRESENFLLRQESRRLALYSLMKLTHFYLINEERVVKEVQVEQQLTNFWQN